MKRIQLIKYVFAAMLAVSCGDGAIEPVTPDTGQGSDTAEEEKTLSGENRLKSFSIGSSANPSVFDIRFEINEARHTVTATYLRWINGSEPGVFAPTFVSSGQSVSVNGEILKSSYTRISFAKPFVLRVAAENGDINEYEVHLNCPQINGELPLMRIIPDAPITSKEDYVAADLDLSSPFTEKGWWSSAKDGRIEIRGRGNSTWSLPKKPYRIKFPDKFSPVGLEHAKAKSWVLLANDMDKSLIRDALGWEISRILFDPKENYHDPMAVLFTPCAQHVNVYMGDEYLGLYLMSDHMERAKGRIEVDKLEKADGSAADVIGGGHIIEVNIHGESAPVRFLSGYRKIQMDHKYPDDKDYDPAQYKYIEDYITQAEKVLYSSSFTDPVNGWRKYFDEKTLADYVIAKELCGDMDGYTSTYFYKRRGCDKLFFGPIWDVDKGWGNDVRGSSNKANMLMIKAGFQMPGSNGTDWFNRFWQDAAFRAFVRQRWTSKKAELVAAVKKAADTLPDAMKYAVEANFAVWPYNYQACQDAPLPAQTYALEIQRIKTLTDQRAAVLDGLFQ